LAIWGLNLSKAGGLLNGNFGAEPGQGSGPQIWQFWVKTTILGLKDLRVKGVWVKGF